MFDQHPQLRRWLAADLYNSILLQIMMFKIPVNWCCLWSNKKTWQDGFVYAIVNESMIVHELCPRFKYQILDAALIRESKYYLLIKDFFHFIFNVRASKQSLLWLKQFCNSSLLAISYESLNVDTIPTTIRYFCWIRFLINGNFYL